MQKTSYQLWEQLVTRFLSTSISTTSLINRTYVLIITEKLSIVNWYHCIYDLPAIIYRCPGCNLPDTCPEMPHVGVLASWAVVFPFHSFRRCFGRKSGPFPSLKRNDLQIPATRVRIRHGGDFPGIKQRRSRRRCANIPALRKGDSGTPAQPNTRHCDKHSILDLPLKNKIVY